ncbi:hypothetical protein [Actinophytocola oryzae]|uniref:hypothetical protein n=1 Tax=Actinophytocola oryzae TaxID=502181 RepID=UPI0014150A57|nr:hypothetical protein [Actinophytocola oryzae]
MSFAFDSGGTWQFYRRDGVNLPLSEVHQAAARIEVEEGPLAKADFIEAVRAKLRLRN